MSLIDLARGAPGPRSNRTARADVAGTYEDARARALALAPVLRSERTIVESIAPVQGRRSLPVFARPLAGGLVTVVTAVAAAVLAAPATVPTIAFGGAFGLALAIAADQLGAAVRGLHVRREWRAKALLAWSAFGHATATTVLVTASGMVAQSLLAAVGLAVMGVLVATVGFASRIGDAELEVRADVRAAAQRKLDTTNQAIHRVVDALRAAYAADVARIAAESGSPLPDRGETPRRPDAPRSVAAAQ